MERPTIQRVVNKLNIYSLSFGETVTDQSTASDIIRKSLKGVAEVKEGDYGLYRMGAHGMIISISILVFKLT